jgi:hypothetical protein
MNRLDEIKARAAYTGTNLNEYEPSPFTIDTARDLLMLDVPALVARISKMEPICLYRLFSLAR